MVNGHALFPAAAFMEVAVAVGSQLLRDDTGQPCCARDFVFLAPLFLASQKNEKSRYGNSYLGGYLKETNESRSRALQSPSILEGIWSWLFHVHYHFGERHIAIFISIEKVHFSQKAQSVQQGQLLGFLHNIEAMDG